MITRVKKYIRENQMLQTGDTVVAGVSGGADSIAMLHILKSLQEEMVFSVEVLHVHHGIRGEEADRDERFVEKICRDWDIPFFARHYPNGSWEKKRPEGSSGNRLFRKRKKGLGFPVKLRIGRLDGFGSHWHIIAMIWQRPCCTIWQEEPASGDFPGYSLQTERSSGRFYV